MLISAIAAMADNRVIGRDNQLPWRLPADLRHFKALTWGKPILMGRKTYDSIGRALPGRQNIILTRNLAFQAAGTQVVHSLDAALDLMQGVEECMLIGGAELYQALLPRVHRIYLTLVHAQILGDSYFPVLNPTEWHERQREDHTADTENEYAYSFTIWERDLSSGA